MRAPSSPASEPTPAAPEEPPGARELRERFSVAVGEAIRRRRSKRPDPPPLTLSDLDLAPRG